MTYYFLVLKFVKTEAIASFLVVVIILYFYPQITILSTEFFVHRLLFLSTDYHRFTQIF